MSLKNINRTISEALVHLNTELFTTSKDLSDRLTALENAPSLSDEYKKDTLKFYAKLGEANPDLKPYADALRQSVLGMDEFAKLGTGLFIHWGVYAVPAGTYTGPKQTGSTVTATTITRNAEWIMRDLAVPMATYKAYESLFNTTKWDPETIATMAEEAGMGYIVITAKHHEGFSLYPSKYTDWTVETAGTAEAPCSLTILEDLKAACERHHLKFGIYYSQYADWMGEGGFNLTTNGKWNGSSADLYTTDLHNEYLDKTIAALNEIVDTYKPYILWWDPVGTYADTYQNKIVEAWQNDFPQIITNDRITYNRAYGDYGTGERTIYLGSKKYKEACFTMNNTWGYCELNEKDSAYYSKEKVFKEFILYSLMYGQNCLMNIGPKCTGEIPSRLIDMLIAMKNFINTYGTFKNYKRVCINSLPNYGYMIEVGTSIYCYIITKGNPASQNVVINNVPTNTNLQSINILTPGTNASYSIDDNRILINNLALDSVTKVGIVRLDYKIAPNVQDATYLQDGEQLNACAFPYTTSNITYDIANKRFTFTPSKSNYITTNIIWDSESGEYEPIINVASTSIASDVYTITVIDSDNNEQTATYTNSTDTTDTIQFENDKKYTIKFKVTGTTTSATAIFNGMTFNLHVVVIHPTSISLNQTTADIEIGGSANLIATILPEDTTIKTINWTTSNSEVATVEDGLVVGVAAGEATITATTVDGGLNATCSILVHAGDEEVIDIDTITLNQSTLAMQLGDTETLTVTIMPENATYKAMSWTSSDETKATVSNTGEVTAVGIGSAIITARNTYNENKFATCVITISGVPVESITLNSRTLTITPGYSETLTATVSPDNATVKAVSWNTSDPLKLSVDTNGNLFAMSAGTVTITATATDGSGLCDECVVTVLEENYDYLFEALSMTGAVDQGEIATTLDGTEIHLFDDDMTNWTIFGYAHDNINKYKDGTTTVESNATLYQCVVHSSPWTGLRVDSNYINNKTYGGHVPMRFRFTMGSETYVNATTGELMSSSVVEVASAPKHPLCLTRDGNIFKFTSDGINWTTVSSINASLLARIAALHVLLTVGFDFVRSGGAQTTTHYRELTTEEPCCVAFKAITEYPFYTLYHRYDSTIHVACADLIISTDDITLNPGQTYLLSPEISPRHCTSSIIYSSSDPTNATVSSNGLITYVSGGETTITLTCDEVVKTIKVICDAGTVSYDITKNLTGVQLSNSASEIEQAQQYTTTLSVTDSDGTVLGDVTVTMDGIDITSTAYDSSTATILINSVTGDIVITASANEKVSVTFTLDSAIKIDGNTINDGDTITITTPEKINWLNSIL